MNCLQSVEEGDCGNGNVVWSEKLRKEQFDVMKRNIYTNCSMCLYIGNCINCNFSLLLWVNFFLVCYLMND
jgi:hypothetical protein